MPLHQITKQGGQCDLYPHLSLHDVEVDDQGRQVAKNGRDFIPLSFILEPAETVAMTWTCKSCKNVYPEFEVKHVNDDCPRCVERKTLTDRN